MIMLPIKRTGIRAMHVRLLAASVLLLSLLAGSPAVAQSAALRAA